MMISIFFPQNMAIKKQFLQNPLLDLPTILFCYQVAKIGQNKHIACNLPTYLHTSNLFINYLTFSLTYMNNNVK
jgi:hypothetical protein